MLSSRKKQLRALNIRCYTHNTKLHALGALHQGYDSQIDGRLVGWLVICLHVKRDCFRITLALRARFTKEETIQCSVIAASVMCRAVSLTRFSNSSNARYTEEETTHCSFIVASVPCHPLLSSTILSHSVTTLTHHTHSLPWFKPRAATLIHYPHSLPSLTHSRIPCSKSKSLRILMPWAFS